MLYSEHSCQNVNPMLYLLSGQGESKSGSAAMHHTLQRHPDILQDYGQEYSKTRANIQTVIRRGSFPKTLMARCKLPLNI